MDNIIWAPQPGSQVSFLTCPVWEVLYGGTRGGGKTDALLMDFAQHVGQGYGLSWRGILFRQTHPQLEDILAKSIKWFSQIFPGAVFKANSYKWVFPEGEQLLLRHMDKATDYYKYHGHEYPWIGWEELTNWPTNECYEAMKSTNRSSAPNMPRKYRATCNPWGAGHGWVKSYFVEPAPPMTKIISAVGKERMYINSNIKENKILLKNDPDYLKILEDTKDPVKRAAWLEGDWDIAAGGFFEHVWRPDKIVVEPFDIPSGWTFGISFDWGSAKPASLGVWALSDGNCDNLTSFYPRGSLIRVEEVYVAKKDSLGRTIPDTGTKMTNEQLAHLVGNILNKYNIYYQFADPSIFKEQGGDSIFKQMKKVDDRIRFKPADNERIPGWQTMLDMMYEAGKDEPERPGLWVFETCRDWIRTIPALTRDERVLDDVNTDLEDHIADETRYMCQSLKRRTRHKELFI